MLDLSVKRGFSNDESLRKLYKVCYEDVMVIYDDDITCVVLHPGDIVYIQREKTCNGWPIVWIDGVDYDIAVEDANFYMYFDEVDIDKFERKMSKGLMKTIFMLSNASVEHITCDLIDLDNESGYYEFACERLFEFALEDRNCELTELGKKSIYEIVDYIMLANKYSGKYTISDWIRDTKLNYKGLYIK